MKLSNVVVWQREHRHVVLYNGEDAPFMDGVGETEQDALDDLFDSWKAYHDDRDEQPVRPAY